MKQATLFLMVSITSLNTYLVAGTCSSKPIDEDPITMSAKKFLRAQVVVVPHHYSMEISEKEQLKRHFQQARTTGLLYQKCHIPIQGVTVEQKISVERLLKRVSRKEEKERIVTTLLDYYHNKKDLVVTMPRNKKESRYIPKTINNSDEIGRKMIELTEIIPVR
jgi:hypothetical protein